MGENVSKLSKLSQRARQLAFTLYRSLAQEKTGTWNHSARGQRASLPSLTGIWQLTRSAGPPFDDVTMIR